MKKSYKIAIGVVIGIIAFFFIGKNKAKADAKALANKNADGTPTATTASGKSTVTDKFKTILNLTYENQALYQTYNGKDTTGIGFLKDGTEINNTNAILETPTGFNYIKRPVETPVPIPSYFWKMLTVDNVYQAVYTRLANKTLADYPSAVGFLENGNAVFARIVDESGTIEYGI